MNIMIDTNIVTIHGARRAKERQKLKNPRSVEKNVQRALQRGKRAEDCTSWERAFLRTEARDGCTAVAYNNFCYIINPTGACVTMYPLPEWFGRKKNFGRTAKERNSVRCCRGTVNVYLQEFVC